jgi:hypothetical protein
MPRPRGRTLWLTLVIAALVVVVGVALQRELTPRAAVAPMVFWQGVLQPKALSTEEEAYAEALWPIHNQVVETSAVAMSFAGVSYVTEHHDRARLAQTARNLHETFLSATRKTQALTVPNSMQRVQDQYLGALALFETASAEMVKVGDDGKVDHLIEAQAISQRAAEDLLKVGDVLWPGEHKPN